MSEYWVSHKKYLCKYCNIYIADDAPSRRQHETGLKHKGNVERFVRGLYKAGEKRKQDLDEEKREIARIEKVRGRRAAHPTRSVRIPTLPDDPPLLFLFRVLFSRLLRTITCTLPPRSFLSRRIYAR